MAISTEELIQALLKRLDGFESVYREHLRDCDELLPHVLFGDLTRHLRRMVTDGNAPGSVRLAVDLLEQALGEGDSDLGELVGVSLVENLEPEGEGVAELRQLFGPCLRAEYQNFWPS